MTNGEKTLFAALAVAVLWLLWDRLHRRRRPTARTAAPPVPQTQDAPACNPDGGCA